MRRTGDGFRPGLFIIFMTYPVSYYELPIEQHLQKVSVNTAEQVEPEFEERASKM